jgi:hypothetical protein
MASAAGVACFFQASSAWSMVCCVRSSSSLVDSQLQLKGQLTMNGDVSSCFKLYFVSSDVETVVVEIVVKFNKRLERIDTLGNASIKSRFTLRIVAFAIVPSAFC